MNNYGSVFFPLCCIYQAMNKINQRVEIFGQNPEDASPYEIKIRSCGEILKSIKGASRSRWYSHIRPLDRGQSPYRRAESAQKTLGSRP